MPDAICCGECGTILPAYWPKALCARCALDGLLDSPDAGTLLRSFFSYSGEPEIGDWGKDSSLAVQACPNRPPLQNCPHDSVGIRLELKRGEF